MHPDTAPPHPTVRLTAGTDIAAALPQLLGFRPHESLVLVAITGGPGDRVGVTLRIDLPGPVGRAAVLAEAVTRLGPRAPAGVVAAVVTEAADVPAAHHLLDLPGRDLLRDLVVVLAEAGVPLLDALLVRDGRCWSYECPDPCCDPGAGTPLPGGTTPLAAAAVLTGQVVAADRAELVARLRRPTGPDVLTMARACAQVGAEQAEALHRDGWEQVAERSWRAVLAAVDSCRPGPVAALPDDEVARVAWAVADPEVRDRALGLGVGPSAEAAQALWTELVRRLPAPLDAAPATLLAACAWARGDGTTAGLALERALTSQPSYSLARLLHSGLTAGMPPTALRELITAARERPWPPPASEQLGA